MKNKLIKEELFERYKATGKIGLVKPKTMREALSLIDAISEVCEEENEEVVLTLKEMSQKFQEFFNNF